MRLKNSSFNIIFNIAQLILTTVLSFVARTFFIKYLGKEMLGLDGLFTNILSMLSLTELGIGTAISFSLYKPLAENDNKKISEIMTMFKKIYILIGVVVLLVGLAIMPILPYFTKGYEYNDLYLIYLLYLINTASSYLIVYKETLVIADQREHKLFPFRVGFLIVLYILQIVFLIKTKDFIVYLIINFVVKLVQNITTNIYIGKLYNKVDFNCKEKIDKKTKKEIALNIKHLFTGKLGDYLLNGTDNIIISAIDIGLTGIYSNYLSIVGIMKTVMNAIYNGVVASFGNMVATEKKDVQENVFDISNFICFVISAFITIELIFLFNPFINIWAKDSSYVVDTWMSVVISFNFYFYSQMLSLDSMKIASGMYKIDRFVPLIQAGVNLIVSIVLGKLIGLGGVILGTLVSYLLIGCIAKPYLVYKYIFNKSAIQYYLTQFKNLFVITLIVGLNYLIFKYIGLGSSLLFIIVKGLIIAFVYLICIIIIFKKTKEFDYLYKYVINIFKKVFTSRSGNNENNG